MIRWTFIQILRFYMLFFSSFFVLIPAIIILEVIGLMVKKVLLLAMAGYAVACFGSLHRLNKEGLREVSSIMQRREDLLKAILMVYTDFIFIVVLSSILYEISSAFLIVPLLWFSVERILWDKRLWFIPTTAMVAVPLVVLRSKTSRDIILQA